MEHLLTLDQLQQYFNVSSSEAIKKLNYPKHIFHASCKNIGIIYWPYRQLKSLSNIISIYKYLLTFNTLDIDTKQEYLRNLNNITFMYNRVYRTGISYNNIYHLLNYHYKIIHQHCDNYKEFVDIAKNNLNLMNNNTSDIQNKMSIDFILN